MGTIVENLVAPAVLRLFQSQGIAVQEVYQRSRSARGDRNLEVDILAVDDPEQPLPAETDRCAQCLTSAM